MPFDTPIPFAEALAHLAAQEAVPTSLSTSEIRELSDQVRRVSILSARTSNAAYVQKIKDTIERLLSPENRPAAQGINVATARAELQDALDALGYTPERGFGDDPSIPPAERGSLRDLSSNARLNLVVKTKVSQMANAGLKIQGNTALARHAYPCWELVRIGPAKEPRDWPKRWKDVGGDFFGGRMIAPKDSPIWAALGDPANFDDAIGGETPPFAFGSHYGWRAVPRETCIELGVIAANFSPAGQKTSVEHVADVNVGKFDQGFLADLAGELDTTVRDGRMRLAGNSAAGLADYLCGRWLVGGLN